MRQCEILIVIFMTVMVLMLTGCTKQNNPASATPVTDEQALKHMVTTIDSIAEFSSSDEATIDDDGAQNPDFDLMSKITVPVSPVRWGRHIFWDQIVRNYTVVKVGDSIAMVTITKTIPGEFWVGIRFTDTVRIDSIIKKPFTETVTRKIKFRRVTHFFDEDENEDEYEHNWTPVAITLVVGKTDSVNRLSIVSVEISGRLDTTITNPLDTWFRFGRYHRSIPSFLVGDSLTVRTTINSADDSAETVVLRHGILGGSHERRRARMNLVSVSGTSGNYVRVYERMFRLGLPFGVYVGRFNATIDVTSSGSIYDDTASFSNEFWGMPYKVVR